MGSSTKKRVLGLILIVVIVASVAVSTVMATQKNSLIWGMAYVDSPVVGATVSVYSLSGTKLFQVPNATSSSGIFSANIAWSWIWEVPSQFKITITGGTLNNQPFNGTLARYIENYSQKNYYAVNPITTIAAAYKDKNPSLSYAAVEQKVSSFLAIPPTVSLDGVINDADDSIVFFDVNAFASEAQANGSFNGFVNGLVLQIDQGQIHPFKGIGGPIGDFAIWAGSGIVSGLAKGAVSYVGGLAMGWVMQKLGYETDTQEILDQLRDMSIKLDQINSKLDYVESQLVQIQNQLTNMEFDLRETILKVGSIEPLAKIDSASTTLDAYAKDRPGDLSNRTLDDWTSAVLSPTTGIYEALTELNYYTIGHHQTITEGLMETMVDSAINQLVQPNNSSAVYYGRDFRNKALTFVEGLTTYFQEILFEEVKGLNLIAEAHHYRNESGAVQSYIQNQWQPMINDQVNLYKSLVLKFVINVELREPLEFPNMGPVPTSEISQLNNYYKTHYPVYSITVPSVAEILPQIFRFADQVSNGTGKFTAVAILMPPRQPNPSFNSWDPSPSFRNTATSKTYQATSTLNSVPLVSYNNERVIYYRTYDFGQLPEGNYVLVTKNPYGWWTPNWSDLYEDWSFHDALDWSLNRGYIQVANDTSGNPYGYWGGVSTS